MISYNSIKEKHSEAQNTLMTFEDLLLITSLGSR